MPWLIKDKPTLEEKLFFVHVPRCGGTSLMQHFDVPVKCLEGRSCWGRFGIKVFFHRYKLLERANFPIFTYGNGLAVIIMGLSIWCAATQQYDRPYLWSASIVLGIASLVVFVCFSFVFTAPVIGRLDPVRRCYLLLVHHVLCRFMESIEWCTGTNRTGYMMHLTAPKLLAYGYVSPVEMERVCTMAIVRNPYSRMVSMYHYNRFGSLEPFSRFVKSWYTHTTKRYREHGEMDEWYTPCHAIPQFEYTHYEGKQLVRAVVKQEELRFLKTKEDAAKAVQQDSTVADLPDPVRDALLGMPHANSRTTAKKWFDYYDQETLDLTYEMYQNDFVVFGYSPILTQRPDLLPPALYRQQQPLSQQQQQLSQQPQQPSSPIADRPVEVVIQIHSITINNNNDYNSINHNNNSCCSSNTNCNLETMIRDSTKSSADSQSSRQGAIQRSSSQSFGKRQFTSSMVSSPTRQQQQQQQLGREIFVTSQMDVSDIVDPSWHKMEAGTPDATSTSFAGADPIVTPASPISVDTDTKPPPGE